MGVGAKFEVFLKYCILRQRGGQTYTYERTYAATQKRNAAGHNSCRREGIKS